MRDKPAEQSRRRAAVAHWVGSYNTTIAPPVGAHPVRDKPTQQHRPCAAVAHRVGSYNTPSLPL